MLVEVTAYRPLRRRNAPPLAFLITAIGASFVLAELVGALTDRRAVRRAGAAADRLRSSRSAVWITDPAAGPDRRDRGGHDVRPRLVRARRPGSAGASGRWRRTPNTAALMGVNKSRVILLVFLLGGLMAGVAAVFCDMKSGYTRFNVGFLLGLKAFAAAVLGGIGNLRGALARRPPARPGRELRLGAVRHELA